MQCIASSIPGRLRLRHAVLRNPAQLARLAEDIGHWPQVGAVSINARTGSLLVHYDALALPESACRQRAIDAVAALAPPAGAPPAQPAVTARYGTRGQSVRRANRLAKLGMLAGLSLSMLLAALGAKHLHAWAGLFFLHALGVHLWVHRRNLLR